ncbi:hypothetical protein AB0K38_32485 [Streptomyces griseoincarnatus]
MLWPLGQSKECKQPLGRRRQPETSAVMAEFEVRQQAKVKADICRNVS